LQTEGRDKTSYRNSFGRLGSRCSNALARFVGERRCSVDEMGAEVYTGRREKEDGPDRDARSGLMKAGSAFLKVTDMLAGSDQYREEEGTTA
jgi:hypothetical protein